MERPQKGTIKQRVAIVYPFPYLDSVPSLCNAALLLAQHGFGVDIFTRIRSYLEKPSFEGSRIQVFTHQEKEGLVQSLIHSLNKEDKNSNKVIKQLTRRVVKTAKGLIPAAILRFLLNPTIVVDRMGDITTVWRRHRKRPYRCFEKNMDFARSFQHVIERIKSL